MPRGRKAKDPFDLVDKEFKSAIEGSTDEDIRKKIAEVAMNDAALAEAKKKDMDLMEKKEALKYANEPYRDAAKGNKQRIAYARLILDARGKDSGDSGIDETTGRLVRESGLGSSLKEGESMTISSGGKSVTIEGKA